MNMMQKLMAVGLSGSALMAGLVLVDEEGEMLTSYVDPVGVVTACFGDTGTHVKLGQKFTQEQCLEKLAARLGDFNKELLATTKGVELTQNEHAAYLVFIYNVGAEAFGASTLLKLLRAGDHVGACNQLPRWVYAKGKKLKGLIKRRERERQICLRGLNHG